MHGLTGGSWKRSEHRPRPRRRTTPRETERSPTAPRPTADRRHRASSRPSLTGRRRSRWSVSLSMADAGQAEGPSAVSGGRRVPLLRTGTFSRRTRRTAGQPGFGGSAGRSRAVVVSNVEGQWRARRRIWRRPVVTSCPAPENRRNRRRRGSQSLAWLVRVSMGIHASRSSAIWTISSQTSSVRCRAGCFEQVRSVPSEQLDLAPPCELAAGRQTGSEQVFPPFHASMGGADPSCPCRQRWGRCSLPKTDLDNPHSCW